MKTETKTRTAYVEIRSQHAKGTPPRQGPNTYVAVQVVPTGATRLTYLNRSVAEKRGIEIVYCGEGYAEHTGPRSAIGQAIVEAQRIADEINEETEQ